MSRVIAWMSSTCAASRRRRYRSGRTAGLTPERVAPASITSVTEPDEVLACISSSYVERARGSRHLARAVDELLQLDADLVEQGEVEIGERCLLRVFDVPRAAQPAGAASGRDNRQVGVVVDVQVAIPLPSKYIEWSRSVPSPSGVSSSRCTRCAKSDT